MTKIIKLANGITVLTEQRAGTGKVSMGVFIKSGSMHESAADNGLTNLMQESTQGGTTTRSHDEIFAEIESAGGSLTSLTSADGTMFSTEVIGRKAGDTFAVLADVLRNPVFDSGEIDQARDQIKQIITQSGQSPGSVARKLFAKTVFGGASIGNDPAGTPALLDTFTPEQVKQKHAELLSNPSNIFISFAGDIDDATAEKLANDYFGDIPANPAGATKNPSYIFEGGDVRQTAALDQLNFMLAFEAPNGKDSDRFAAMMLKETLAGGMSRPLFQEIREKRGLVYTVGAGYTRSDDTGYFVIVGGAGKGNAGELVSVTMDLFGQVARDGFPQRDLDEARERILRRLNSNLETASGTATSNLAEIVDKGRVTPLAEFEANLKKVTPDDLKRVAYNMLNAGKLGLSAVGPLDTLPPEQDIKDMMKAQVAGITPPAKQAAAAPVTAAFNTVSAVPAAAPTGVPKMTVLPNGLKVITLERPGNLSAGAWVGAGSDYEAEANNGATHMLEHMVFKGTPNWPSGSIDKYVEGVLGGGLNAYTTRDKTAYYYFNLEPSALEKIVEISGEMVFAPTLENDEFDGKVAKQKDGTMGKNKGERDVVIEELRRANDNAGNRRHEVMAPLAYPDQPHGWSILGPETTLRAMTVEQLQVFHDEFYAPNNVIFSAAGPVKHEDFVALVEQKFGHLKPNYAIPDLPVPVYKGGTAFEESRAAKVANIGIGAEGVSATDPDSQAYEALAAILGGGQSSRLYKELVTEQGIVPGVGAGMDSYRNAGMFLMAAGVEKPENVKLFLNSAYKVLRETLQNVTQDELDRAKTAMEMSVLGTFETNDSAANQYAVDLQAHGKVVLPSDISAAIQQVTLADIKRVAAKVLASNPTVGGAVPPGTDPAYLPTHAEVVAMRDGTWQPAAANTNKPKPPAAIA